MKVTSFWFAVFVCFSNVALAGAAEPVDLQTRYGHYYTTYVVNEDGTAVESREWSRTLLKDSALEWGKRASASYSTSAQTIEVVAAYTKKADGRRIDVGKDNYQVEINRGRGKDSPVYSDRTTLTVVFPEVAVGDTVVFSYRLVQTEPLFPGHFSVAQTFSSETAYDDIRVRFDYPPSLWVQYNTHGMTEKEKSEKDGRRVIEWRYANPKPLKSGRRNFTVWDPDRETGYAFSTFKTYANIAAAYGARAMSKAAVTERIETLAAEIVKDKKDPKDQMRALYEWVATNITYAGNCIGIGAVVPRDLPVVLDNRMGDCKDHATLLQALLAARGIKSTQALVNSGSVYRLPKIPVVSSVNHVITYVPAFNLYIDSTADWAPFGMLPFQDQDKPVLLVEGYKEGAKTPVAPVGANQQRVVSKLKIADDGSISGAVEVFQKGLGAAQTRAWARKLTRDTEQDLVKDIFRGQGMIGSGTFEKDDPTALSDSYRYKTDLTLEKFINRPGAGAFKIYPLTAGGSIQQALHFAMEPEQDIDIACMGGKLVEEYAITLPKGIKVLSVPDDLTIKNDFLSYHATYRLKGNNLTVMRALDDRTKGNVCSPQVMARYRAFAEKVMDNVKAQVLYK